MTSKNPGSKERVLKILLPASRVDQCLEHPFARAIIPGFLAQRVRAFRRALHGHQPSVIKERPVSKRLASVNG